MAQDWDKFITDNYHAVLERITLAAQRAQREPQSVRLVVVTKGQPAFKARAAVRAGARDLGENYPEEGVEKMASITRPDVRWHMIGHVQRRKSRLVVAHYDMMHSLDSLPLAQRLNRQCAEAQRVLPVLLEFNVGGETSKFGWPAWDESQWEALWPEIEDVLACEHLMVQGVMTVPPPVPVPEAARPYFQRLRRLRDTLARRYPAASWEHLSMGMSADFEVAVEEGATLVRVGSAILGPRQYAGGADKEHKAASE